MYDPETDPSAAGVDAEPAFGDQDSQTRDSQGAVTSPLPFPDSVQSQYPTPPPYQPPAAPSQASPPLARTPRRWPAVMAAGLLGGVAGAALLAGTLYLYPPMQASTAQAPVQQTSASQRQVPLGSDQQSGPIEAVAARVTPSVVNVSIEQSGVDPFTGATGSQIVGNGSGVIIRSDGYILTNNHVVQGADRLLVRIGTEDLPAKVVGTDPSTDLAVVKVDRKGLPAAEMGDSTALKVGETVIAIGSPFGLDKTVTSGIVSALHRTNLSSQEAGQITQYTNLIQTDASINPGNSGGALVDLMGRVVGINTLIQSPAGQVGASQSAGIGFAIPMDFAKGVADQLIATGHAQHPFMGIAMAPVDSSVASQLGLPANATGALIQEVVPGSPAEKAGVKVKDVIVEIGGDAVTSVEDAFASIRSRKIGDKVDVVVLRGGKRTTLAVTLGSTGN